MILAGGGDRRTPCPPAEQRAILDRRVHHRGRLRGVAVRRHCPRHSRAHRSRCPGRRRSARRSRLHGSRWRSLQAGIAGSARPPALRSARFHLFPQQAGGDSRMKRRQKRRRHRQSPPPPPQPRANLHRRPERGDHHRLLRGGGERRVQDPLDGARPCNAHRAYDETPPDARHHACDIHEQDHPHHVADVVRHQTPPPPRSANVHRPARRFQARCRSARTHPRSRRGRRTRFERWGHGVLNPLRAPPTRHVRLRRRRPELPTHCWWGRQRRPASSRLLPGPLPFPSPSACQSVLGLAPSLVGRPCEEVHFGLSQPCPL